MRSRLGTVALGAKLVFELSKLGLVIKLLTVGLVVALLEPVLVIEPSGTKVAEGASYTWCCNKVSLGLASAATLLASNEARTHYLSEVAWVEHISCLLNLSALIEDENSKLGMSWDFRHYLTLSKSAGNHNLEISRSCSLPLEEL